MDILNSASGPVGLVVLALLDSTSMGTFIIPLLLLMLPAGGNRKASGRTIYYLGIIGVFYWLLGLVLLSGLLPLAASFGYLLETPVALFLSAAVGGGLLWYSFWVDPDAIRRRGGDPEAGARRWMDRVQRSGDSVVMLTGLALLAGIIEAASMLPYLAAMGIVIQNGWSLGFSAVVLAGYCLIMILPALLMTGLRCLGGAGTERFFRILYDWGARHAASTLTWVTGILGVMILLNTVPDLVTSVT